MPGPTNLMPKGFQMTTAVEQFRWVTQIGNETAKRSDALGQRAAGIVQESVTAEDATNGRVANVWMQGISRAIAGDATPVKNARVTTTADGRTVAVAAGQIPLGIVVAAPAVPAAGDHIDVELTPGLPAAV